MGAISLDEFDACLYNSLMPARAAVERTQAPLASNLLGMLGATVTLVEQRASHTPTCEEEALLAEQKSGLPRSTGSSIRLRTAGHLSLLELNDPSYFNALTMEMASDMLMATEWLASQGRGLIRGVVLQGAGDHFCPGGNVYRMRAPASSLAAVARASIHLFDGFCRLRTLPAPIVCAAHGAVLGGGLAICLLLDFVTCNDAATFQVMCICMCACKVLHQACAF